MEVLMDYHLFFMAVAFFLLALTMVFLFVNNTKDKTFGALILAGINWLICLINSLAFFGIGIIGIDSEGAAIVTAHHEMYSFYAIFYMLYWVNIIFMFYCYWLWVRNPWKIGDPGSSEIQSDSRTDW